MDSIIELQRQTHEEIERYERALYTLLSQKHHSHEAKLQTEHKTSQVLDRLTARTAALNSAYIDDTARKAEVALLSAPDGNQDDLAEFYSRLVKVQDHYRKYPDSVVGGFQSELATLMNGPARAVDDDAEEEDPIALLFSGEEGYGKYLDLYSSHTTYNNLKNISRRLGYLQYIDALLASQSGPLHQELPQEVRSHKDYETYVKALHSYLLGFIQRSQPLLNVVAQQQNAEEEFNAKWTDDTVPGWEGLATTSAPVVNNGTGIWCSACEKMYSKQTVYDAHLTSKKHIKSTAKQASAAAGPPTNPNGPPVETAAATASSTSSSVSKHRTAALFTYLSQALIANLVTSLNDTKANVERRFSLTAREREQELFEQQQKKVAPQPKADGAEGGDEDDEEERIYNPLKLPLGWDGKPIPYWLYKLHGLGVEYRCEICSDHLYMGRKNFERHFQESRHAFGMRALGLPNTKHFHEITKIADALALAERLKREGRLEINEAETMEELEDDEGNVYNRKTYDDLKNQGLI